MKFSAHCVHAAVVSCALLTPGLSGAQPHGAPTPTSSGGPIARDAPSPHGAHPPGVGVGNGPPSDRSVHSPLVPPKTIEVQVVGLGGANPAEAQIELVTTFQSIAEGNSSERQSKTPGPDGKVRFAELDDALRYNYAVEVEYQGAHYSVGAFRLGKTGHSVQIHVYPSTHDINDSFIGMRGFQYVQLREGFFRVDVMYRVMNMSQVTWLPKDVLLKLPEGAEAVDVRGNTPGGGFEDRSGQVELVGTYPPGQKDVQFSYQIPSRNDETLRLEMGLPPHLAELRVLAEKTPNMVLDVPGFEAAQPAQGPDGKEVLITGRTMQPGQSELKRVTIELSGLPTVGPGRWFAVALAGLLGGGGLAAAARRQKRSRKKDREQLDQARTVLLDEMALLERAHRAQEIGPRTYEETKREILLSLARLERAEDQLSAAAS